MGHKQGTKARIRHQHTVSKFFLAGFADESGQLVRVPLNGEPPRTISKSNAAVGRDFYSVDFGDGKLNDFFERKFGSLEDAASPILKTMIEGSTWPLAEHAKKHWAGWVALQHLRTHAIRQSQADMHGLMIQLVVGSSGKRALRQHIQKAIGEAVSNARLDAEWRDLTKPGGPTISPDPVAHIRLILDLLPGTTAMLADHQWSLNVFPQDALLTSDHPVALIPSLDHPAWSGVGLATAGAVAVNLTRHLALVIGASPGYRDTRITGDLQLARSLNAAVINNASRAILHHPQDRDVLAGFQWSKEPWRLAGNGIENFIREDGLFTGIAGTDLEAMSQDNPDGEGVSLSDLEWPIPGRRFNWTEPPPTTT